MHFHFEVYNSHVNVDGEFKLSYKSYDVEYQRDAQEDLDVYDGVV